LAVVESLVLKEHQGELSGCICSSVPKKHPLFIVPPQKSNMVRTKVFVGNLSFQIKEAELATQFGAAGKVISANIITRGPRSLGYGFVEMDSEQDADNAVKVMNKKEINGRPINVEIAKPQEEHKDKDRQPKEGETEENKRPRRPRRRSNGRRRQEGESEQDGKAEVNDEKREEGGAPRQQRRRPRRRSRSGQDAQRKSPEEPKEESKTTLFVANLPFSLGPEEFSKIVTDQGLKLKTAHVVKKRNGRSKGYGFIEFETQDDQQKALAVLNKKQVEGRELSVKIALTEIRKENEEPKEPKEAKPVEKKPTPPPEKKAVPVEKKAVLVEKKAPVEKKAASPVVEKKAASPVVEKKTASPSEKKTATPEKKEENK